MARKERGVVEAINRLSLQFSASLGTGARSLQLPAAFHFFAELGFLLSVPFHEAHRGSNCVWQEQACGCACFASSLPAACEMMRRLIC